MPRRIGNAVRTFSCCHTAKNLFRWKGMSADYDTARGEPVVTQKHTQNDLSPCIIIFGTFVG